MTWREYFTIEKETQTYAKIRDDAGEMIVNPDGLDVIIEHASDGSDASIIEYDNWCRKYILKNALEIYGAELNVVADIINEGGHNRTLYVDHDGEMHMRMTPPADGWLLSFDLTDMHANADPNVPWDGDAVLDYIEQWSEGRQIVYCP